MQLVSACQRRALPQQECARNRFVASRKDFDPRFQGNEGLQMVAAGDLQRASVDPFGARTEGRGIAPARTDQGRSQRQTGGIEWRRSVCREQRSIR
jgi:hypothetical protein